MSASDTQTEKKFEKLCFKMWEYIFATEPQDEDGDEDGTRKFVTAMTLLAWNTTLIKQSLSSVKKGLQIYARRHFDEEPWILNMLQLAAKLKWQQYPKDRQFISSAEVTEINGQPRVSISLEGDSSGKYLTQKEFQTLMEAETSGRTVGDIPAEKRHDMFEKYGRILSKNAEGTMTQDERSQPHVAYTDYMEYMAATANVLGVKSPEEVEQDKRELEKLLYERVLYMTQLVWNMNLVYKRCDIVFNQFSDFIAESPMATNCSTSKELIQFSVSLVVSWRMLYGMSCAHEKFNDILEQVENVIPLKFQDALSEARN